MDAELASELYHGSYVSDFRTSLRSLGLTLAAVLLTFATYFALPFVIQCWRLRKLPVFRDPQYTKMPWLIRLLLGNVELLEPNHHLYFRKAGKHLGGIFKFRILTMQSVVIVDARWVNVVLGASEGLNKCLEPDNADAMVSVNGHRTLFSSDTNSRYWKLIRKGTAGAFQQKHIKDGYPEVLKMAHQLVAKLKALPPGTDVDINNITMRYAMDVTGLVGFAKDFKTCATFSDSNTDEIFDLLRAAMLECHKRAVNPIRKYMLFNKEVREGRRLFVRFQSRMGDLVKEVKARGPPKDSDVSIAAHLLRLRDPDTNQLLSEDLLTGEFGIYFSAGIESAGNAMSWTLLLISQYPEVEAKILKELDAIGLLVTAQNPNPRAMQLSDLVSMPYFVNVCKETMRVKPVASTGTTRILRKDLQFGDHIIPQGTMCICPFDAIHHNSLNWEDPDEFKPERWEADNAESLPGSTSKDGSKIKRYLAFSTGPRQCIGQSLARMMHDIGVAVLLSHFHFRLADKMGGLEGVEATEINRLTLQPGTGLWMNATTRGPFQERPQFREDQTPQGLDVNESSQFDCPSVASAAKSSWIDLAGAVSSTDLP